MDESNKFHLENCGNFFGKLDMEFENAFARFPLDTKNVTSHRFPKFARSRFHRLYRASAVPTRIRTHSWQALRRIGLDQSWFHTFQDYWSHILAARPLWGPEDLYFLRGYYRLHFQTLQVPDDATPDVHAAAYRQPQMLYFLLHQVYKEKIINHYPLVAEVIKLKQGMRSFLEYGCGTAPVATSFFDFVSSAPRLNVYLADLESLHFQYAAYKFQECGRVKLLPLLPENGLQLTEDVAVDAIFCMTAYEHMNAPLLTTKRFYNCLKPDGLLIFDFIKSEGKALDSASAARERGETLAFIQDRFDVVRGEIDPSRSVHTTICRKRA